MIQQAIQVLKKWAFDPDPLAGVVQELNRIQYGEVAVNPASIAAGAQANTDVAVAGLVAGDVVLVQPPATLENLVVMSATVPATGTLRIRLFNPTAGAIDGASLTWTWVRIANRQIQTGR